MFNFKNVDCQKTFFNVTENTTKLSSCFQSKEEIFLNHSDNFLKVLNKTFHQCFTKIRIKNKRSVPKEKDDIQKQLNLKTKLQQFLKDAKSDFSRNVVNAKIDRINQDISALSADKNAKLVQDQLGNINFLDGTFSQVGLWKVKSKLFPRNFDPPMAKKTHTAIWSHPNMR